VPGRRAIASRVRGQLGFTLIEILLAGAISALLLTAAAGLFGNLLELSRGVSAGDEIGRDIERAVALLRRDIAQARGAIAAGADSLALRGDGGASVRYARRGAAADTLVRAAGGGAHPVAGGVVLLDFALHIVERPYTEEKIAPALIEREALAFEPGDWDAWIGQTDCTYESRGERRIKDREWVAEEFWGQGAFAALTRAAVRVRAKDKLPTEVDILVEVYRAADQAPRHPAQLVAQGRIASASMTEEYQWQEVPLTTVDPAPIEAGGRYWLVCRPASAGGGTYAGHLEYERIKDCDSGEWPGTDMTYRQSNDAGASWSEATHRREAFFRLYGLSQETLLTEVSATKADTLGVAYRLALQRGEVSAHRGGFIAFHNP